MHYDNNEYTAYITYHKLSQICKTSGLRPSNLIKIENIQITTYNNHTMKDKLLMQSYNSFVLIFPTKSPRNDEFEC